MAILKKSTPRQSETKVVPDDKDGTLPYLAPSMNMEEQPVGPATGGLTNEEGQLALDVFQTADEIVVVAPIAGVKFSDLSITITDEVLTLKGRRNFHFNVQPSDYFTQECFWGHFSRSVILPESVDTSNVSASFKTGILTIRIPKIEKIRTRMIKIREE
ncbi:MAG: Hsp20/alpha crystallin family protein [Patescibacteria group bacterium]